MSDSKGDFKAIQPTLVYDFIQDGGVPTIASIFQDSICLVDVTGSTISPTRALYEHELKIAEDFSETKTRIYWSTTAEMLPQAPYFSADRATFPAVAFKDFGDIIKRFPVMTFITDGLIEQKDVTDLTKYADKVAHMLKVFIIVDRRLAQIPSELNISVFAPLMTGSWMVLYSVPTYGGESAPFVFMVSASADIQQEYKLGTNMTIQNTLRVNIKELVNKKFKIQKTPAGCISITSGPFAGSFLNYDKLLKIKELDMKTFMSLPVDDLCKIAKVRNNIPELRAFVNRQGVLITDKLEADHKGSPAVKALTNKLNDLKTKIDEVVTNLLQGDNFSKPELKEEYKTLANESLSLELEINSDFRKICKEVRAFTTLFASALTEMDQASYTVSVFSSNRSARLKPIDELKNDDFQVIEHKGSLLGTCEICYNDNTTMCHLLSSPKFSDLNKLQELAQKLSEDEHKEITEAILCRFTQDEIKELLEQKEFKQGRNGQPSGKDDLFKKLKEREDYFLDFPIASGMQFSETIRNNVVCITCAQTFIGRQNPFDRTPVDTYLPCVDLKSSENRALICKVIDNIIKGVRFPTQGQKLMALLGMIKGTSWLAGTKMQEFMINQLLDNILTYPLFQLASGEKISMRKALPILLADSKAFLRQPSEVAMMLVELDAKKAHFNNQIAGTYMKQFQNIMLKKLVQISFQNQRFHRLIVADLYSDTSLGVPRTGSGKVTDFKESVAIQEMLKEGTKHAKGSDAFLKQLKSVLGSFDLKFNDVFKPDVISRQLMAIASTSSSYVSLEIYTQRVFDHPVMRTPDFIKYANSLIIRGDQGLNKVLAPPFVTIRGPSVLFCACMKSEGKDKGGTESKGDSNAQPCRACFINNQKYSDCDDVSAQDLWQHCQSTRDKHMAFIHPSPAGTAGYHAMVADQFFPNLSIEKYRGDYEMDEKNFEISNRHIFLNVLHDLFRRNKGNIFSPMLAQNIAVCIVSMRRLIAQGKHKTQLRKRRLEAELEEYKILPNKRGEYYIHEIISKLKNPQKYVFNKEELAEIANITKTLSDEEKDFVFSSSFLQ